MRIVFRFACIVFALASVSSALAQRPLPIRSLEGGITIEHLFPRDHTARKPTDTAGVRGPDGKMRIDFGTYVQIDHLGGTLFKVWKRKGSGRLDQAPIGIFDIARGREVLPCGPFWFFEKVEGNVYVTGGGQYNQFLNAPQFKGLWDIGEGRELQPCTSTFLKVYPGKVVLLSGAQLRTIVVGLDGRELGRYASSYFPDDAPAIQVAEGQGDQRRWGFLDLSGKALTPLHYSRVAPFQNGFSVAQREGKFTLVDAAGREIVPAKYLYLTSFTEGLAAFATRGRFEGDRFEGTEWGFLGPKGEELGALRVEALANSGHLTTREGRVIAKHAGRWIEIDPRLPAEAALAAALPARFEPAQAADVSESKRATAPWGFRVPGGAIVIAPQWDHAQEFVDGFGIVGRKAKSSAGGAPMLLGVVDATGREVLPLTYQGLRAIDGPLFTFAELTPDGKGLRFGIVDAATRQIVLPARFEEIGDRRGRLLMAKQNGAYGLMTFQGEFIVPPIYTYIGYFNEGLAVVRNANHGHWIDTDFKPVMADRNFVSVDEFVRGTAIAATKWDQWQQPAGRLRIDRNGNTVGTLADYTGKIVVTPVHSNQSQRCPACNGSGGRFREVQESSSAYIGNLPGAKTDFHTVTWNRAERIGNCFTCGGSGRATAR